MNDFWADVREEFKDVGDPLVDALLADADALLAVVRAVNAGVDICGVCGGFMSADGHTKTCEYAALPEHLK